MQDTLVYINAVHFNAVCLLGPMSWLVLSQIANCHAVSAVEKDYVFCFVLFFGELGGGGVFTG